MELMPFNLEQLSPGQGAPEKVHINQYELVPTSSSLVTLAHVSALVLCSAL